MIDGVLRGSILMGLAAAAASAQATVRPLPQLALLPEATLELAARNAPRPPGPSTWSDLDALADQPVVESVLRLDLFGYGAGGAGLENSPGQLEIQRGGWNLLYGQRVGDDDLVSVQLEAEASFYNFNGANNVVPGSSNAFNDVYRTTLGLNVYSPTSSHSGWFGGVELELAGEDEVGLADGLTVGGVGGVRYVANDALTLSFGLAAQSRLEDTPWVIPFLGFEWSLAESLRLEAQGTRVALAKDLGETWTVALETEYELRQYRLNDNGPLPSGAFRDETIRAGLALDSRAQGGLRLHAGVGTTLWQELNTFDNQSNHVGEVEVDSTWYAEVGLKGSF